MQFGENLVFFCFFSVFLIFVYLFFFFALKAISLFWRSLYHSPSPRAEVPSDDHRSITREGLRVSHDVMSLCISAKEWSKTHVTGEVGSLLLVLSLVDKRISTWSPKEA